MQPLELSDVSGLAAGRFCHLGGYFVLGIGWSVYVGSSAEVAGRCRIQMADIRARWHALRLCVTWIGSLHYAVDCCLSCLVIFSWAQFLLLNSNVQSKLYGIPMLCTPENKVRFHDAT